MDAFIRQYQYNSNMAPDRIQLQNLSKRNNKSFKEYAQRWQYLAAQVVPPMAEREMIMMIMDMLTVLLWKDGGIYAYELYGFCVYGEMIEVSLKKGKFDYVASTNFGSKRPRMNEVKKIEGEAHVVATVPTWPNFPQAPYNPMYQYPPHQYHYSTNINLSPCPIPLWLRAPNRPENPPPIQPRPNTTPNLNLNTNLRISHKRNQSNLPQFQCHTLTCYHTWSITKWQ